MMGAKTGLTAEERTGARTDSAREVAGGSWSQHAGVPLPDSCRDGTAPEVCAEHFECVEMRPAR